MLLLSRNKGKRTEGVWQLVQGVSRPVFSRFFTVCRSCCQWVGSWIVSATRTHRISFEGARSRLEAVTVASNWNGRVSCSHRINRTKCNRLFSYIFTTFFFISVCFTFLHNVYDFFFYFIFVCSLTVLLSCFSEYNRILR